MNISFQGRKDIKEHEHIRFSMEFKEMRLLEDRAPDRVDVGKEREDAEGLLPIDVVGARRCILVFIPVGMPSRLGFEVFFRGEVAFVGDCFG